MPPQLQPSLLDRLTDEEPDARVEGPAHREISTQVLRQRVRRDLAWLFNTANLATVLDLDDFPNTASSVVNFGLADLTGRTASSVHLNIKSIERMIQQAIWSFEPRLIKNSVRVEVLGHDDPILYNQLSFTIHAQLWAEPLPIRLALRTELNLETGDAQLTEVSEAEAD